MTRSALRGPRVLLVAAAAAVALVLLVAWTHRMRAAEHAAAVSNERARVAALGLQELAPPGPEAVRADERVPVLDQQLAELIEELRRLRLALEAVALPGAREPVSSRAAVDPATESRLDRIETLVARLGSTAAATARRPLELPPLERRTPDLVGFQNAFATAREQELGNEFARRYFLWTQQQVLDHFGIPDSIWNQKNGSIDWGYFAEGDGEALYDFTLRFHDGLVTAVE